MPRGRTAQHPRSWNEWFDRNVKYLFLSLSIVAAFSLVAVALNSVRPAEATAQQRDI